MNISPWNPFHLQPCTPMLLPSPFGNGWSGRLQSPTTPSTNLPWKLQCITGVLLVSSLFTKNNILQKILPHDPIFLCANNGNALYNGPWAKAYSHRVRLLRSRLRGKCCEMPLPWRLLRPGYHYKKSFSFFFNLKDDWRWKVGNI